MLIRYVKMTTTFLRRGDLIRKVLNEDERTRLVSNVVGHLKKGVSKLILEKAFKYWTSIDKDIGERIKNGVRS